VELTVNCSQQLKSLKNRTFISWSVGHNVYNMVTSNAYCLTLCHIILTV